MSDDKWRPPSWAKDVLNQDHSGFLEEKQRDTGKGKIEILLAETPRTRKKKKRKKKKPDEPTPVPPTPQPVQITYEDWLLSALKTLDIASLDSNGNGMIELTEFQARFNELNPELTETIFIDIDTDQDFFVTLFEYEVWRQKLDQELLDYLRANYKKYPSPEPSPEPEEPEPSPEPEPPKPKPRPRAPSLPVKRVRYIQPLDESSLLSILKTMDYLGLGSNDLIHWNDFRNFFARINTGNISSAASDNLLKIFSDIDRNSDQYISHDEYREWIGKLNSLYLDKLFYKEKVTYSKPISTGRAIDRGSLIAFLKTLNAESLDKDGDGYIVFDEMRNCFKQHYAQSIGDDVIAKIYYDVNDNLNYGRMSIYDFNEWLGRLNTMHLDKILAGSTANAPKESYNAPQKPQQRPFGYHITDKNKYENRPKLGYREAFSLNQKDIGWLLRTLKTLNIRSLEWNQTNTIQSKAFEGYCNNLEKKIPEIIVEKIWNSIDIERNGRVHCSEYTRWSSMLDESTLKAILIN